MTENCKLYETLVKCNSKLDEKHNPKSYECDSNCPFYGKCFYTVNCNPQNAKMQGFFGGWQKYLQYTFNGTKDVFIDGYHLVNALHLINSSRVDDIVIFRIAKKNKDSEGYSIKYLCKQANKQNVCANLVDLNKYIDKHFEYMGRKITKEDF